MVTKSIHGVKGTPEMNSIENEYVQLSSITVAIYRVTDLNNDDIGV